MPEDQVQVPDDDPGFICKACGRFFTYKEVKQWDTKWTERESDGERTLLEMIYKCPFCGEIRSYIPNESTFRDSE